MRSIHLFCAVLVAAVLGMSPALAEVLIKVDKASQRMTVSVDGDERHSWPVSTGLAGYRTPKGSFTPFRLEEDHYSKEWDEAPMPHSIFFTSRGHAIHGSDAVKRLGSPASHGCIRLSRANAATLFSLVKSEGLNNTKIVVTGEESVAVAKKRAPATRTVRREVEPRGGAWWSAPRVAEAPRARAAPGYYAPGVVYAPANPYAGGGGYRYGW